ncbi:hypothetical protein [Streptomyces sp. RFCAC02]|uniref:hypothetical protein n=1 Tax=Streptomyces sp. RFCAC02 TaxID=2499143 RepID=UPI00101EFB5A|nr:hypothetical protein [Streptomyces sp. RFCAC02]
MSDHEFTLDLDGLDVDTIDVLPADSVMTEGHGAIETGASCSPGYCSCYSTAMSCFVPEEI